MKTDIRDKEDIKLLVDTFYTHIQQDSTIGPIFTEVVKVDWMHHLPKMYNFWESILFGKATYKGNPMLVHFDIRQKVTMSDKEFEAWKNLFFETVDALFKGENATLIKQKAQSIADLMKFKLNAPASTLRIL